MASWLEIVIALCTGGSIGTVTGQMLANRSASRREREARRGNFSIQNFAAQREALERMQELAAAISREISEEYLRRLERKEFKYFDAYPTKAIGQSMIQNWEDLEEIEELVAQIERSDSEDQRALLNDELMQAAMKVKEHTTKSVELGRELIARVEKRGEHSWNVITPLLQDFINNMYRTGSQPVTAAAQAYLQATMKLYTRLISAGIERFQDDERSARRRLEVVIGKALKEGPYAK